MAVEYVATVNGTDYGFDWVDQEIEVEAGVANIVADDLKDAIREAEATAVGMSYDDIMSGAGDPTILDPAQGIATDRSVILLSGWRVLSLSTTGTFTLGGGNIVNIVTGVDVLGQNTQITSINNVSQAGTRVSIGSGLDTTQDANLTFIKNQLTAIENSWDHNQIMRLVLATLASILSGPTPGQAGTVNIRDILDTKNRISMPVDANGNRTGPGVYDPD